MELIQGLRLYFGKTVGLMEGPRCSFGLEVFSDNHHRDSTMQEMVYLLDEAHFKDNPEIILFVRGSCIMQQLPGTRSCGL